MIDSNRVTSHHLRLPICATTRHDQSGNLLLSTKTETGVSPGCVVELSTSNHAACLLRTPEENPKIRTKHSTKNHHLLDKKIVPRSPPRLFLSTSNFYLVAHDMTTQHSIKSYTGTATNSGSGKLANREGRISRIGRGSQIKIDNKESFKVSKFQSFKSSNSFVRS